MINSTPQFRNCTVHHNSAGVKGGGVYVGIGGNPALTRCVVSFAAAGGGIYGETTAVGATVACCDVFGNAGGNYAGSISDQTGVDDNISADPVFCDAGVSPPDLSDKLSLAVRPRAEPVRSAHRRARRRMRQRRRPRDRERRVQRRAACLRGQRQGDGEDQERRRARRDRFLRRLLHRRRRASAAGDDGGSEALRRRPRGGGFRRLGDGLRKGARIQGMEELVQGRHGRFGSRDE